MPARQRVRGPSRGLSSGAGFAEGFAKTFVAQLQARQEEARGIREEERASQRMLQMLKAQTDEEIKRAEIQSGIRGREAQEAFERQFDPRVLERAREMQGIETEGALDVARGEADIEAADPAKKMEQALNRLKLVAGAWDAAGEKVKSILENAADPSKIDVAGEWERAIAEIEQAAGLQEHGITLSKPVPNEIVEQTYLGAIEKALSAQDARDDLTALMMTPGAVKPSQRVIDYFEQKWGEPFENRGRLGAATDFFGTPDVPGGLARGIVGGARALGMASAATQALTPSGFAAGIIRGRQPLDAATQAMRAGAAMMPEGYPPAEAAQSITDLYMNGRISFEEWMQALLGAIQNIGGQVQALRPAELRPGQATPSAPAPVAPPAAPVNEEEEPAP
jgi:hypothetical protein